MKNSKRDGEQKMISDIFKFREKRKWQIALRRYVLERNRSVSYAPYFGLDIEKIRKWFEYQFDNNIGWDNFGKLWQFGHVIPVAYFDFSNENDLKLCWNFINLRVELLQPGKSRGNLVDLLSARNYFKVLYEQTQYAICKMMLDKIERIEMQEFPETRNQINFITENRQYLDLVENYSAFEFELLNLGKSIEDVQNEIALIKNMSK